MRKPLVALCIVGAVLIAAAAPGLGVPVFTNVADSASGFKWLYEFQINERGVVAFVAQTAGGVEGVYRGSGGPVTTIADTSGPYSNFHGMFPSINRSGLVAFFATIPIRVGALHTGSGGPVTTLYSGNNTTFEAFGSPWLNDSGQIAFATYRSTDGLRGIYRGDGGPLTTIDDNSVEGPSNWFGYYPALNNSGQVGYTVVRPDGTPLLFRGDGVTRTTIAAGGDSLGSFFYFNDPDISDTGLVAFRALTRRILGGDMPGIYVGDGGPVRTIVDDTGPFEEFWLPAINDRDQVAFMAILDTGDKGIFVGPDPVADRVIRVGDSLFGSTVTDLMFFPGGYNSQGQLAFEYYLADGRTGVAVANTIPEPGSLALLAWSASLLVRRRRRD